MAENRRDVLSGLETIIGEITSVTTVVRSYKAIDITNYKEADLPIINIKEQA